MRKEILVGLLLLAGCQNVVGPLDYRRPLRVDDPSLSIEEQKRRGRDRLALPDDMDPHSAANEILPRSMVTVVP
jgi:hypothetical protein